MGACSGNPLGRKDPELRLGELGTAILGPRGELWVQKGTHPFLPFTVLDLPPRTARPPSLAAPGQGRPLLSPPLACLPHSQLGQQP